MECPLTAYAVVDFRCSAVQAYLNVYQGIAGKTGYRLVRENGAVGADAGDDTFVMNLKQQGEKIVFEKRLAAAEIDFKDF